MELGKHLQVVLGQHLRNQYYRLLPGNAKLAVLRGCLYRMREFWEAQQQPQSCVLYTVPNALYLPESGQLVRRTFGDLFSLRAPHAIDGWTSNELYLHQLTNASRCEISLRFGGYIKIIGFLKMVYGMPSWQVTNTMC